MLRPLCTRWAYRSGTDAHPERAGQCTHQFLTPMLSMRISFPIFQSFILYTLSMRVRKWCLHWACASGTDACIEHAHQELMRTLSIRVWNWCVHWAYATRQVLTHAQSAFLQRMRSIRIRNWCVPWAYGSGTDAYPEHPGTDAQAQRAHQKLNDA